LKVSHLPRSTFYYHLKQLSRPEQDTAAYSTPNDHPFHSSHDHLFHLIVTGINKSITIMLDIGTHHIIYNILTGITACLAVCLSATPFKDTKR
ncbi:hypothetical protein, partial [Moraxella porci]|uniref:hypothetical protein n=1 Tax=Moraxella porci TaxID=1288392 RepID=UPI00244731CD